MREGGLNYTNEEPEQVMKRLMGFKADGQSLFDNYCNKINEDEGTEKESEGMGAFMQAYRLTGESKVEGVCDFVETLVDAGAKFLVFAHHQVVMDHIESFLDKKKIGNVRIDGKVKTEERHERVQKFQSDPIIRVAILSITAAS